MNLIYRPLFAAALMLAIAIPAASASFDCRKASEDFEKIVCADPQLSALDDSLATAYRTLMDTAGASGILRDSQRTWAVERRRDCMSDQAKASACLRKEYGARIAQLGEYLKALRNPQSGLQRYSLDKVSPQFDLTLRLLNKCKAADDCSGPAIVDVKRKASQEVLQSILVPNLEVHMESGGPLVNSNAMYGYGGAVNVADYNLDGQPDIALQTGNYGPYAQPSYDILLNTGKGFRHNAELTALSTESLNSLEIEGSQLVTSAKSGCCNHSRSWYQVVHDKPVPVRRVILDSASDDKYHLTIEEHWKNGKWRRTATNKERKEDYCEDTLQQAAPDAQAATKVACMLMPGNSKLGIIAYAKPSGQTELLEIVLARISDGSRLASYVRQQPFGGKVGEIRLLAGPVLKQNEKTFSVLVFFDNGKGSQWGVETVLQREGNKLVPLLDNLLANFGQTGATRLRTLKVDGAKLIVHESAEPAPGKPAVTREVPLEFDGKRYVIPPDMQYKP